MFDESEIEEIAREGATWFNKRWFGESVEYEAGAGKKSVDVDEDGRVRIGAQVPSPASPAFPPAPAAPSSGPFVTVHQVRQLAQHLPPIIWALQGAQPGTPVPLSPAVPALTLKLKGRGRISAWAKPDSRWVDPKTGGLNRQKFAALDERWGLDDITLVQTVRIVDPALKTIPKEVQLSNGKVDPDAIWWASNFMPTLPDDAAREKWLRDAIQFFHSRRIQVFAGYEIMTQDWTPLQKKVLENPPNKKELEAQIKDMKRNRDVADAFMTWLNAKDDSLSAFDDHAAKLVGFFDSRELDIDGVSYDLEIDSKNSKGALGLNEQHREKIRSMFLAVGAQLALKERYLAFAAAPLPPINPSFMQEQPFSLGLDRNILIRPMSYDIGKKGRESVIQYTLRDVKVHPSHLQVGIATGAAVKPVSPGDITEECKTYRRYRAGVIHWFMELSTLGQYQAHDRALNPDAPPRGTLGQPLQGPLGPQRLAAFAEAQEKEKEKK